MTPSRTIVVGGGIAGLAAAWALARSGANVELLEREPTLGTHSSGRNAAIFRCLDPSPGALPLAQRSAVLLDLLLGGREAWLRPTGVLYVARAARPLAALWRLAKDHRLSTRPVSGAALRRLAPALDGGAARHGLFSPDEGVIDTHAVLLALAAAVRAGGGRIRTGCTPLKLHRDHSGISGLSLCNGELVPARGVVIAAGAWAAELGARFGAPAPLLPLRRHLALLEPKRPIAAGGPVVWSVDDELYFRGEAGGVLASPCDEAPCPPGLPQARTEALCGLGEKLALTAPRLADAGVRKYWAGLRTFAPDRAPVIGADPRLGGLYWLAGLGGHGMSIGIGAGELLASLISGKPYPRLPALAPARLIRPGSGPRLGNDDFGPRPVG